MSEDAARFEWVLVRDYAQLMGVSEDTVRRWCRVYDLPHTRIGRIRVRKDALDAVYAREGR